MRRFGDTFTCISTRSKDVHPAYIAVVPAARHIGFIIADEDGNELY